MDNTNETFNYTYSAENQEEIKRIREKYISPSEEEDKLELLRRLDKGVTKKGSVWALCLGITGALVMGSGMSLCMVWEAYVLGIIVGAVGIIGVLLAYPVYTNVTAKERERIKPEIMRLTDELMK